MLTSKSKVQYEWGFLAAGLEGWGIPRFVRCVVRAEREGFLSTSRTPVTRAEDSPPPAAGVFGVLSIRYTLVKRASSQLRYVFVGQKRKVTHASDFLSGTGDLPYNWDFTMFADRRKDNDVTH